VEPLELVYPPDRPTMLIACPSCRLQYDVEGMKPGDHVRCRCGRLVEVPKRRPREARILHCSACGGKVREKASKCDYCGGEITLAERNLGLVCPECYARLPVLAAYCSHCGIPISPQAIRTTRASAKCPRCQSALVLREHEKTSYTECTRCSGIWLDAATFERVLEAKDTAVLAEAVRAFTDARPAATEEVDQVVKYLPCPVCSGFMLRKNFGGCSGIVIDWCKGHGFWFDGSELEKVMAFINSGGLDKSRQQEILRSKRELERLKEQKSAWNAVSARGSHLPAWSSGDGGDLLHALSWVAAKVINLVF